MQTTPEFTLALAWSIVSELFWRHHASCHLRVEMELHNGDSYWCIVLRERGGSPPRRLMMNLVGDLLEVGREPSPERLDALAWSYPKYQEACVSGVGLAQVVDDLEGLAALPTQKRSHPKTTEPVLAIRALAALTQRCAFGSERLKTTCALQLSSMFGPALQDWLAVVDKETHGLTSFCLKRQALDDARKLACRYWRIEGLGGDSASEGEQYVVLDLARARAIRVQGEDADPPVRLMPLYDSAGRRLGAVVDALMDLLR